MDLAKANETCDGLKDLVLREQFMQASSKNLQVFLKERKVKSVHEMADVAEQYNETHGTYESVRPKQQERKLILGNNSRERQVNPSSSYQRYRVNIATIVIHPHTLLVSVLS